MAPFVAEGVVVWVTVAVIVIVGHGVDVTVKDCVPEQPFASFAVME